MGVHIDSDEYERHARRLADHRGTTVDEALTGLLRRELEQEGLIDPEDEGVRRARLIDKWQEERLALLPPDEREERLRQAEEFMAVVRGIQDRVAAMPVLDPRSSEEIMRDMYDEDGLPK